MSIGERSWGDGLIRLLGAMLGRYVLGVKVKVTGQMSWVRGKRSMTYKMADGATVAQRVECSPPTQANRARSSAGLLPDIHAWGSCRTMPLAGGFSRRSPVPTTVAFWRRSILTSLLPHRFFKKKIVKSLPNSPLSFSSKTTVASLTTYAVNTSALSSRLRYWSQPEPTRSGNKSVILCEHVSVHGSSTLHSNRRKTTDSQWKCLHEPRWCSGQTTRLTPRLTVIDCRWGRSRIFACGNRAERCRWSAGFLGDLPFPPPLHSRVALYSSHFALFGFQSLDIKSLPKLSTPVFTLSSHSVCIKVGILFRSFVMLINSAVRATFLTSHLLLMVANSQHHPQCYDGGGGEAEEFTHTGPQQYPAVRQATVPLFEVEAEELPAPKRNFFWPQTENYNRWLFGIVQNRSAMRGYLGVSVVPDIVRPKSSLIDWLFGTLLSPVRRLPDGHGKPQSGLGLDMTNSYASRTRGRAVVDVVATALASHQGEPGPIPVRECFRVSHMGIMTDDAARWRVFSGISCFRHACIPTLHHIVLSSPFSRVSEASSSQIRDVSHLVHCRTRFDLPCSPKSVESVMNSDPVDTTEQHESHQQECHAGAAGCSVMAVGGLRVRRTVKKDRTQGRLRTSTSRVDIASGHVDPQSGELSTDRCIDPPVLTTSPQGSFLPLSRPRPLHSTSVAVTESGCLATNTASGSTTVDKVSNIHHTGAAARQADSAPEAGRLHSRHLHVRRWSVDERGENNYTPRAGRSFGRRGTDLVNPQRSSHRHIGALVQRWRHKKDIQDESFKEAPWDVRVTERGNEEIQSNSGMSIGGRSGGKGVSRLLGVELKWRLVEVTRWRFPAPGLGGTACPRSVK
ncbi:hypothetical protein PR048_028491 [Dryococelus australis]|uniref:Uncharacterized protein n=1 Tax=Dryococelus australis TaxID=614101 RepID=A0ABQ9GAP6_9NEOP|nr:hypothetical protein PR048_028491 [Dryococelus australis]